MSYENRGLEDLRVRKRVEVSKTITPDDILTLYARVGLDSSSNDVDQLNPLVQTIAAGLAWAAAAKLTGSDLIPVFNQFQYSVPIGIGDKITAIAEVDGKTKEGSINIHLFCRNQKGELVLEGCSHSPTITPSRAGIQP